MQKGRLDTIKKTNNKPAEKQQQYRLQLLDAWYLQSEKNLFCKYLPVLSWILLLFSFFTPKTIPASLNNDRLSTSCKNKKHTNTRFYRMNNPGLNWKAMATHRSQFVWYRRLFVVFSCYTYYNILTVSSRIQKQSFYHRERRKSVKKLRASSQDKEQIWWDTYVVDALLVNCYIVLSYVDLGSYYSHNIATTLPLNRNFQSTK